MSGLIDVVYVAYNVLSMPFWDDVMGPVPYALTGKIPISVGLLQMQVHTCAMTIQEEPASISRNLCEQPKPYPQTLQHSRL